MHVHLAHRAEELMVILWVGMHRLGSVVQLNMVEMILARLQGMAG